MVEDSFAVSVFKGVTAPVTVMDWDNGSNFEGEVLFNGVLDVEFKVHFVDLLKALLAHQQPVAPGRKVGNNVNTGIVGFGVNSRRLYQYSRLAHQLPARCFPAGRKSFR